MFSKNFHRQFRVGKQTAGILLRKGIANVWLDFSIGSKRFIYIKITIMLLLLSIVMKQLHLSKFYKLQLFALTREYLVNLSILMIFLSIEVERFDKKKIAN